MNPESCQGGALETEFIKSGADFVKLNRRFPLDLYLASQLRRVIKERGIQIVHGYQAVEGLHLYFAAHGLKNVKKILSFQGFITDKKNRLSLKYLIPRMDANIVVSEGLPVAVSEAMLSKVPMILSDIEPLSEVSGGGKYAEIFEVKNAEMLSEKILRLLKDKTFRKDPANRVYEFAKANFSIEAHLRELRKLYESL